MEIGSEMECGDGRCRDMFLEFLYIVVLPGIIMFTIVFFTSILMCRHSCKRKKSTTFSDETQLLQYNSIRRASLNLRHLSRNRDTPLLSGRTERDYRTVSLNLDGEERYHRSMHASASAPGTLQRDNERRRHRHQRYHSSTADVDPLSYGDMPVNTATVTTTAVSLNGGESCTQSGVEYAEINHEALASGSVPEYVQNEQLVI
ncbi:uncharacterized protein LOC127858440 [Dreissena polymorpha]|uniref:Uncharacterized protein n=1 Tax=Dreissena polymorpha TaxID=45954 RepID=A0A9D3Z5S7_DREPO|nr:uncharacterized protein LOC127858440 [Dreissena polymorpha]KAH3712449.1 hypothetical protein DPMN_072150 [Dreissena polymorpha]